MSGSCVARIACPTCGDESSLQVFEEDGVRTGYCFQPTCKTYYNTQALSSLPDSDVEYTPQEPKDISWVDSLGTFDHPARGLLRGAYKHFGVKHGLSTSDGRTLTETYYPRRIKHDTTGYKVRLHDPKKFYTVGSVRNADPFGWKEALEIGGYSLYVTEGEEDSVAMFTAWMRHKKQKVAVISLAQGADSVIKTLQPVLKDITDKWKQVVFCPDYDEKAGDVAVKAIIALFPEDYTVKIAKYSEKDANDMVLMGKEAELVSSCYNAGKPLSSAIKEFTLEDFDIVKKAPEFGISFPYEGLTELLRGIRLGTTVYIAAPEKAGKSTLVNEIATHLMLTHNEPIFAIKPEESEEGTLRRMAGAAVGKVFYDPKVPVKPEDVDRASALLAGKLFVLERSQTPNWKEVRQLMREANLSRGIKYFFIDPITNLSSGMSNSDRDSFLSGMTREVAEDAKSLGYTVFLFCHLKTVKEGLAWSEGRVATADDFAGSRSMVQSCDVAIAMQAWMLTEGDDFEYLNKRRVLHVLREREYNAVGKVDLIWNPSRGKLQEVKDD
jgi:twinkle protein